MVLGRGLTQRPECKPDSAAVIFPPRTSISSPKDGIKNDYFPNSQGGFRNFKEMGVVGRRNKHSLQASILQPHNRRGMRAREGGLKMIH